MSSAFFACFPKDFPKLSALRILSGAFAEEAKVSTKDGMSCRCPQVAESVIEFENLDAKMLPAFEGVATTGSV